MTGTRLSVGVVLSTACQPVAQALVDFWQCDNAGVTTTRLPAPRTPVHRRFGPLRAREIVPGVYPGRTRHIHVKVQAQNRGI